MPRPYLIPLLLAVSPLHAEWKPAATPLTTKWGKEIKPDSVWQEYPRPQFVRDAWTNLNGLWSYAVTPKDAEKPPGWAGEILVPFCPESSLSGVGKLIEPTQALWYRRTLPDTKAKAGQRTLLHFGAVDYDCTVWVGGKQFGTHRGGNTPFSFDITDALASGNELIVKVLDATEEYQLRGKQALQPGAIFYTRVTGIWQTVWLENVSANHLTDIDYASDIKAGTIQVTPKSVSPAPVSITASFKGKTVATAKGSGPLTLTIPDAKLWSPDSPNLYDLKVELLKQDGSVEDTVQAYTAIRSFGKTKDAAGNWQLTLNDKPVFHWGPLDQGWWPDGLLTPPSDAALLSDIEYLKAAGFNMIRKHIKVEPARFYHHCDRLGMLVWQDQVSAGNGKDRGPQDVSAPWTRLRRNPKDAVWSDDAKRQFVVEYKRMVDEFRDVPSIAVWSPFNEAWGQHDTMAVGKMAVDYDKTRTINIASGGNFFPVGDVVDAHKYPHPGFPFEAGAGGRFDDYIKVVGEFGGHGLRVEGHEWDTQRKAFSYGKMPANLGEWKALFSTSIDHLIELKRKGISAGVYTQTSDVETELNGLLTYDRIPKVDAAWIKAQSARLLSNQPVTRTLPAVAPAMSRAEIEAGLKSRDRALYVKEGWIRDPYIVLGPDDFYYLTGTTINPGDPREKTDPYNIGLGPDSAVGDTVQLWRSKDLIEWEYLGTPFTLKDSAQTKPGKFIWAPEIHWIPEMKRWALVHCPKEKSNLALSTGPDPKGPWTHPMGAGFAGHHDPSLFKDGDTWWVLSENTEVAPLSPDFSKLTAAPVRIDPAGSRPDPANPNKAISRIGHEGATMIKVGGKYVHIGTAWSTDKLRKGSYNLYYCTSDKITGPYGPRKFIGRFLGHGTPFQTRDGQWWCTAFYNANVPPLPREGIETRDLSADALTINQRGLTLVPLDVKTETNGDVSIRALDPAYATAGPDEVQKFAD
jgi:hypothetical protein